MAISLGEINSFRANPDVATGKAGVVLKDTGMVDNLMKAAQFKAENDWRKYTTFLGNYKEKPYFEASTGAEKAVEVKF